MADVSPRHLTNLTLSLLFGILQCTHTKPHQSGWPERFDPFACPPADRQTSLPSLAPASTFVTTRPRAIRQPPAHAAHEALVVTAWIRQRLELMNFGGDCFRTWSVFGQSGQSCRERCRYSNYAAAVWRGGPVRTEAQNQLARPCWSCPLCEILRTWSRQCARPSSS